MKLVKLLNYSILKNYTMLYIKHNKFNNKFNNKNNNRIIPIRKHIIFFKNILD